MALYIIGAGALVVFIAIKYWEIPTLFGWRWKGYYMWGLLGLSVLLYLLALGINFLTEVTMQHNFL